MDKYWKEVCLKKKIEFYKNYKNIRLLILKGLRMLVRVGEMV